MADTTFNWETAATTTAVTLLAEEWRLRLGPWRVVWQRPTAVRLERDGQQRHLPVVDVTRRLQWAAFSFIGLNAIFALWRRDLGK